MKSERGDTPEGAGEKKSSSIFKLVVREGMLIELTGEPVVTVEIDLNCKGDHVGIRTCMKPNCGSMK
jgi:hypothetical protein